MIDDQLGFQYNLGTLVHPAARQRFLQKEAGLTPDFGGILVHIAEKISLFLLVKIWIIKTDHGQILWNTNKVFLA